MKRRPHVRVVHASCRRCGSRVTWDISPLAFVRYVRHRPETEPAWKGRCPCGERLKITAGEARRAA